ncbi:MAG: ATP-binding protein [bacterium]
MKLDMKFSEEQVISAGRTRKTKMSLSEHAQQMVFAMFTKNVYSNPIGSIVREITSNCYDAIKEAGVDTPVVVELKKDMSDSQYISFIDKGIGMSPKRIEKVYGVYFESTKRDSNDEIGGFGIGGKTPMAYTNSFFVITTSEKENEWQYNNELIDELYQKIDIISTSTDDEVITKIKSSFGDASEMEQEIEKLEARNAEILDSTLPKVEYVYSIYKGSDSPEIELLQTRFVNQSNGTEVKVPIKENDVATFEREVTKQLYYFENIIFKGFNENVVTNDYQIYKGDSFLFRVNNNSLSNQYSNMHVCLGQVAYPIDFYALGLDNYKHNIPLAIKLNIGDVNVTASRESLDYNEETKKLLIEKINQVIDELTQMLVNQYDNVQSIEDYYDATENFGKLKILDRDVHVGSLVSRNKINFSNFKYNEIIDYIPKSHHVMKNLFEVRRYGKKRDKSKSYNNIWSGDYNAMEDYDNIYYSGSDFKRVMLKQSYLAHTHNQVYFIVLPVNLHNVHNKSNVIETLEGISGKYEFDKIINGEKLLVELQKDFFTMIKKQSKSYDDLEVPESFIQKKKAKDKISADILKREIPVNSPNTYSVGARIQIKTIYEFKGRVFYGVKKDEFDLNHAYMFFNDFFDRNKNKSSFSAYSKNDHKSGIMFIQISKQNVKLIENFKNVHHVSEFYGRMLRRKLDAIVESYNVSKIKNAFDGIDDIFGNVVMKHMNPELHNEYIILKNKIKNLIICRLHDYQYEHIKKIFNVDYDSYVFENQESLDNLVDKSSKLQPYMKYINLPYYFNPERDGKLVELINIIFENSKL